MELLFLLICFERFTRLIYRGVATGAQGRICPPPPPSNGKMRNMMEEKRRGEDRERERGTFL